MLESCWEYSPLVDNGVLVRRALCLQFEQLLDHLLLVVDLLLEVDYLGVELISLDRELLLQTLDLRFQALDFRMSLNF